VYFKYWLEAIKNKESIKKTGDSFEDSELFGLTAGIKRVPKTKR